MSEFGKSVIVGFDPTAIFVHDLITKSELWGKINAQVPYMKTFMTFPEFVEGADEPFDCVCYLVEARYVEKALQIIEAIAPSMKVTVK